MDGDICEERLRDIVDRYQPRYIFQPKFNNDISIITLPVSYTYGLSIINTHLYVVCIDLPVYLH